VTAMDLYWLEHAEAELPADNDWLSAEESACLNGMRFPKRRADWRLGRWTAKRAVAICLNMPTQARVLAEIEIRPAQSGAPEVFVTNQAAALSISLSHRAGVAACAVVLANVALGCDLETVEPRSDGFVADYFTAEEQALCAQAPATDRFRLLALLWSGKESALKALHTGLRLDTRSVTVRPSAAFVPSTCSGQAVSVPTSSGPHLWSPLHAYCANGQVFSGWWQETAKYLRTVVIAPPSASPIFLAR